MEEVYILKKLGGLGKLEEVRDGFTSFSAQTKGDNEEGSNQGSYKLNTFPDSTKELSVAWNAITESFCWGGSKVQLDEIIKEKKLKFDKDHPRYGQTITPDDVNLNDINDPFIQHEYWWNRKVAIDGECLLKSANVDDRFFILSYKGNLKCVDKTEDDGGFNVWADGAEWELTSPKLAESKKSRETGKIIDALTSIRSAEAETRELFCKVLSLPYDKDNLDSTTMNALYDAANNPAKQRHLGGMTFTEKLTELFKLKKADLVIYSDISTALAIGILRNNGYSYTFITDDKNAISKVDASNEIDVVSFFSKNENQDQYLILRSEIKKRVK